MERYLSSGVGLIVSPTAGLHGREIISDSLRVIRLEEHLHTNKDARMLSLRTETTFGCAPAYRRSSQTDPNTLRLRAHSHPQQLARTQPPEGIIGGADNSFPHQRVYICVVFGVEHALDPGDWDSGGYPITSGRTRKGGNGSKSWKANRVSRDSTAVELGATNSSTSSFKR